MHTNYSNRLKTILKRGKPITKREVTLPSGHHLSLRFGDITEEEVGAIVNAANSGLVHGGGVAGAIVRKGGYEIQDESDRVGRVKTGQAAITGAGKLAAQFVIHAVGPYWRGQSPEENDRLLASAATVALEIASERGLNSIALPAISAGIFGFPKHRCASVLFQTVQDWAAAHPKATPRDLRFTIIDQDTFDFFETEFDTRFPPAPRGGTTRGGQRTVGLCYLRCGFLGDRLYSCDHWHLELEFGALFCSAEKRAEFQLKQARLSCKKTIAKNSTAGNKMQQSVAPIQLGKLASLEVLLENYSRPTTSRR